jgi:hypothetical protein
MDTGYKGIAVRGKGILAIKGCTSYIHTTLAEKGNLTNMWPKRVVDMRGVSIT